MNESIDELINDILNKYTLKAKELIKYGFEKKKVKEAEIYTLKRVLNDELYLMIEISKNDIKANVYESDDDEEFMPFNVKDSVGTYIAEVRKKAYEILEDIKNKCYEGNMLKDKIIEYAAEKYQTIPEYPWERTPTFFTLKTAKKNKWYLLYMEVPYKSLKTNKEGVIDAINIKLDPEEILKLIDNKNFFPAYHMNKKYWITILLNDNVDLEKVKELIDKSYIEVEGK